MSGYSPSVGGGVNTLAAADATVTVGGTPSARNVKVAKVLDSTYVTDFAAAVATLRPAPLSTRVWTSTAAPLVDTGGRTAIGFEHETRDELNGHDPVVNNSRVTIVTAGRYRLVGQAGVLSCKQLLLEVWKNGTAAGTRLAVTLTAPNAATGECLADVSVGSVDLAAGDFVELVIEEFGSGANTTLDVTGGTDATCWFLVERVS